jgi:hypothetical protein
MLNTSTPVRVRFVPHAAPLKVTVTVIGSLSKFAATVASQITSSSTEAFPDNNGSASINEFVSVAIRSISSDTMDSSS